MFSLNLSFQTITLWMVGISLLPRLLSSYSTQIGTVVIILFWVAMIVLLPEFVENFDSKKKNHQRVPLLTSVILLGVFLSCTIIFLFRFLIFDKDANDQLAIIRRTTYLLNPLICIALVPVIEKIKRKKFLLIVGSLTLGMMLVLIFPNFLDQNIIGKTLNNLTAFLASTTLTIVLNTELQLNENIFYGHNFSVLVGTQCGSSPQILLSLFTIFIFHILCPINSLSRRLTVIMSTVIITFISNSIRITLLGYLVSINQMERFDFWHEGLGSLMFSLISTTLTCFIYYSLWQRENPDIKK